MSEQTILFAVLSCPPLYRPIKNPQSNQLTRQQTKDKYTTLYDGRGAYLSVYLSVSEPFMLKLRSRVTNEEFRTKAHYCSCQADYVLTARDFVAVRKSIFTWKTEVSSAKLNARNFSVDRHGLHVFAC